MKTRIRENRTGFTIVELLIVIAVACMMMAIGIPNVVSWLPKYRLKRAANDLYSNLQLTKLNAVKQNKDWAAVFVSGSDTYLICSDPGVDGSWSNTGDNTVEKTVNLNEYNSGVGYGHGTATKNVTDGGAVPGDEIDYTDNVVVFNSQGIGGDGATYINNETGTDTYAIRTTVSGGIALRKWIGSDWN